jgi:hypothetical protein
MLGIDRKPVNTDSVGPSLLVFVSTVVPGFDLEIQDQYFYSILGRLGFKMGPPLRSRGSVSV